MTEQQPAPLEALDGLPGIRPGLADLYRDLHAHPELSFEETRTAAEAARRARALGYEVTEEVGRTGVVATLDNGTGPTVLLRADFDALPVQERTGLDYASTVDGVMHACGHDMHVTCLLGTLHLLADARARWSGRIVAVFQPAEEIAQGAQAMIDDNFFDRFGRPDIVLGQHVGPLPAGTVGWHAGPSFAAADSLDVVLHGKGAHGSRPEAAIDPVVMAAATVLRLQTVVAREVAGSETAVLTVGALQAGTQANIIPDRAELKVNIRTYDEATRARVLAAVNRIVRAEATASGAEQEPEIREFDRFPVLTNDPEATDRTVTALRAVLGAERVFDMGRVTGSEDVGLFATTAEVPICYWMFGGLDPDRMAAAAEAGTTERDIPSNHSPFFAPLVEPTITTGVTALTTAALAWLEAAK
ncbi:amidohydrolase [Streptomyces sp. VRA16 Mangrove soil]|uniref:amidohydrolase n=1 Tax=Streptomyces sp. VRA16 Mangrove soil TaxID=2817434 RepID=UPI001A9E1276|nr:amidohydrolase [Streptomyces sp. VRA16 Mangrove soil]MBO1337213.1 amidohydrolase [Streptomyces sp. VRA16 Mangrove soil]